MNSDPYVRAMFGQNAVQIPFNCIVQADPDTKSVAAIVVVRGPEAMRLTFGSKRTHQLILGDAVIRPHAVIESNHCRGYGLTGLATSGFRMDEWAEKGKIILDSTGRLAKA
jgi:hypothetical protein